METYIRQNKAAWEYDVYQFWVSQNGSPAKRVKEVLENPEVILRKYAQYFIGVKGLKVAVICGSCGKKAVPLAVLGAEVTVFDISAQNARYARETAEAAGVGLEYVVGDVLDIDMGIYGSVFDIAFMEGGILHYFHGLDRFMSVMHALLAPNATMVLSDFHPLKKKILDCSDPDYFSENIEEVEMPLAPFYLEEKRTLIPKCLVRRYTISEIINAVIRQGFIIKQFDEHPAWDNEKLPGEFTIVALST